MTNDHDNRIREQLEEIDIPVYLGEPVFNEEDSAAVNISRLGKGKRSGGVYRLQKDSEVFVVKFYEELSSYENDTTALNLLYAIVDDNPDLKIDAVRQINPKFSLPKSLTEAHSDDLKSNLDCIEGSVLTAIWPKLPKAFKSDFIQSIEKLEAKFQKAYSQNGFTIETELRKRKGLLSHRKTPTLRMSITKPGGENIRYCLHGGNFVITKKLQLVVIDPR